MTASESCLEENTSMKGGGAFNNQVKKPRIELHIHLEGAVRVETIWDLAQKKGLNIASSLEDLRGKMVSKSPAKHLLDWMPIFDVFMPLLLDDAEAAERIAYELCETQAQNNVVYSEIHYCPHLWCSKYTSSSSTLEELCETSYEAEVIVTAVNRGLRRGEAAFSVRAQTILCCIRGRPDYSQEILSLCQKYKNDGVAGIGLAACAAEGEDIYEEETVAVFKKAKSFGIRRSIHAGEAGTSECVARAIDLTFAERIGHGYKVLDDLELFQRCIRESIHFETCPTSSFLTGSYSGSPIDHPLIHFVRDNASCSINTDDPVVFGISMESELKFCREEIGLSEADIAKTQLHAAKSSFLSPDEKKLFVSKIKEAYYL